MGVVDDVLAELGLSYDGLSLNQVKQAASAVNTSPLEQMATVFESGHRVLATHHGELEKAVDTAVAGWKGKAAQAASTRVLSTAFQSRDAGYAAQSSASAVRQFVSTVKTQKQHISTVQPVDTSFHAALSKAGGPAAILLSPTAIVANMAASQHQSVQHQKQAVGYLKSMNDAGTELASEQQNAFPTPPPASNDSQRDGRALPASLTLPQVSDPGHAGSTNPGYQQSPGGAYVVPPGAGGSTKSVHHPNSAPGGAGGTGAAGGSSSGSGSGGHSPVALPPPNGGGATPPQSGAPGTNPAGAPASPPPAALPLGALPGSASTVGTSAGVLAGGGALLAAGGLTGAGRAALGGAAGARGFGGAGLEDGSVARLGSGGIGGVAGSEGPGAGLGRGLGGGDASAEPLRAGSPSPSSAGELAAGESGGRGMYPGGMGGSRGAGDEELGKRPDYLVETDDIWGDGRLAAPPVLG